MPSTTIKANKKNRKNKVAAATLSESQTQEGRSLQTGKASADSLWKWTRLWCSVWTLYDFRMTCRLDGENGNWIFTADLIAGCLVLEWIRSTILIRCSYQVKRHRLWISWITLFRWVNRVRQLNFNQLVQMIKWNRLIFWHIVCYRSNSEQMVDLNGY